VNSLEQPALSRRELLKVGLCASVFLSTVGLAASLSGCSASTAASGFSTLRSSDLPFLQALIPVVLDGSLNGVSLPQAIDGTLHSIDHSLQSLSPQMLKVTQQLFDVLALPLTRGPLTGVWGGWENAGGEQVQAFLQRWQHSSLDLLRLGHGALLQLTLMAWYSRPESWAHCGYPGPPTV
jgi:hypothetical protein